MFTKFLYTIFLLNAKNWPITLFGSYQPKTVGKGRKVVMCTRLILFSLDWTRVDVRIFTLTTPIQYRCHVGRFACPPAIHTYLLLMSAFHASLCSPSVGKTNFFQRTPIFDKHVEKVGLVFFWWLILFVKRTRVNSQWSAAGHRPLHVLSIQKFIIILSEVLGYLKSGAASARKRERKKQRRIYIIITFIIFTLFSTLNQ